MAKKTIPELKHYFEAGKRPTESQFGDLIDSYVHLDNPDFSSKNYKHKDLYIDFPEQQNDMAIDILFGNSYLSGWIEVEMVGAWRYDTSVGIIKKQFQIGVNPDGNIWYPTTSRIIEAAGTIINNIYIGDIEWDLNINQYKLTIYHTSSRGNPYFVRITNQTIGESIIDKAVLSNVYVKQLIGQNKHTVYYNDNLGVGTKNPKQKLTIAGNQQNIGEGNPTNGENSTAIMRIQPSNLWFGEVLDFGMNVQPSYGWIQAQDLNSQNTCYNLVFNPLGGNVGIGIQNPIAKFHINQKATSEFIDAMTIDVESFGTVDNQNESHFFRVRDIGASNIPFIIKGNGNVGIGNANPDVKLDVVGVLKSYDHIISGYSPTLILDRNTSDGGYTQGIQTRLVDGTANWFFGNVYSDIFVISTGNYSGPREFILDRYGNATVKGIVTAKDFVTNPTVTANHVFSDQYKLQQISDLESFIQKNNHLPEIPSAKEMQETGLLIGDFQMKLLKKIEELTLYIIDQNKEIEKLKKTIYDKN
jgi:hypothetical protein